MLNTEQIKMPQSKLQNTGYQPVEALFFLYCQLLLLCSFSLSAAPPSPDQCVQKVNRDGAYNSVVSIAGFGTLAHKPGSAGGRAGAGGGRGGGRGIYVEANPDFTFYLPRHIGRDG